MVALNILGQEIKGEDELRGSHSLTNNYLWRNILGIKLESCSVYSAQYIGYSFIYTGCRHFLSWGRKNMPPVNYMDTVICNTKFHTMDITRAADSLDTVGGSYWKVPNIVLLPLL